MTDAMNKTMLELLPLRYEDGSDYCTVTDANGGNVALTVQPELIKAMEAALRAAAQPHAEGAREVSNSSLENMINAGIKAADLYEIAKVDILRRDHLRRFLRAAIEAAQSQEAPLDLISHHTAWRSALEIVIDKADGGRDDMNDKGYWQHELRAFDRVFAILTSKD